MVCPLLCGALSHMIREQREPQSPQNMQANVTRISPPQHQPTPPDTLREISPLSRRETQSRSRAMAEADDKRFRPGGSRS